MSRRSLIRTESPAGLAGWLFADMLLALTVVGFATVWVKKDSAPEALDCIKELAGFRRLNEVSVDGVQYIAAVDARNPLGGVIFVNSETCEKDLTFVKPKEEEVLSSKIYNQVFDRNYTNSSITSLSRDIEVFLSENKMEPESVITVAVIGGWTTGSNSIGVNNARDFFEKQIRIVAEKFTRYASLVPQAENLGQGYFSVKLFFAYMPDGYEGRQQ